MTRKNNIPAPTVKDKQAARELLGKIVPFENYQPPSREIKEAMIKVFGSIRTGYDYIVDGLKSISAE